MDIYGAISKARGFLSSQLSYERELILVFAKRVEESWRLAFLSPRSKLGYVVEVDMEGKVTSFETVVLER